jgi:hypothetical protein
MFFMTGRGKIARLPQPIREQINQRLENGGKGRKIAEWLNTLTEVTSLLAAEFDGQPVPSATRNPMKNPTQSRNGAKAQRVFAGFAPWRLRAFALNPPIRNLQSATDWHRSTQMEFRICVHLCPSVARPRNPQFNE